MAEAVFDPVKKSEAGKRAMAMKWSTRSLDLALNGLDQGQKLVANPFYENNTKLLKGDLVYTRTPDEIQEWIRCSRDVVYFANKYCKLMTPEGIQNIHLRPYQENYLKHLQDNRLSIYLSCRQSGKCLSFLTKIRCIIDDTSISKKRMKYINKKYSIDQTNKIYELPLYELYNMVDHNFKWKIEYHIYKLLDKLSK